MICIFCDSDHCLETNMDGTKGCCVCFNKTREKYNEEPITLCEGCKKEND